MQLLLDALLYSVFGTALLFHWVLPRGAAALFNEHYYAETKALRANGEPSGGSYDAEFANTVHVYEFDGVPPHWDNVFCSAYILTRPDHLDIVQGANVSQAKDAHASGKGLLWGTWRRLALWQSRQLSPFQRTVVAIEPTEDVPRYYVSVVVLKVDAARILAVLLAVCLFFASAKLARNAAFYYATGCGLGVCMSLAVVVFLLYRIVPKKPVGYSILIGGWSLAAYVGASVWRNAAGLLLNHAYWVAGYVLLVSLVSLAAAYRLGPPTDGRTHNLCQWLMQLAALAAVFAAVQVAEAAAIIGAALVALYLLPLGAMLECAIKWWRLKHPRPRRLLTSDEFEAQGRRETERALRQLQQYCQSPQCSAWTTVNRLRSPLKFAQFVEGSPHVDEDEVEAYEHCADVRPVGDGAAANSSGARSRYSERYFTRAVDPDLSDDSDFSDTEELRRRFQREGDLDSSDEGSDTEFRLNYVPARGLHKGSMSTGKRPAGRTRALVQRDTDRNGSAHRYATAASAYNGDVPATVSVTRSRRSHLAANGSAHSGRAAAMKRYRGAAQRLDAVGTTPRSRNTASDRH